jgi:hypothetical protein
MGLPVSVSVPSQEPTTWPQYKQHHEDGSVGAGARSLAYAFQHELVDLM